MQGLDYLKAAVAQRASDVHFVPGLPPLFRIDGQLVSVPGSRVITSDHIQAFVLPLLNERQRLTLANEFCVDFPISIEKQRYRGIVLFQNNGVEAIFRVIPSQIPTPEEILLPPVAVGLSRLKSGLVLVTGPTGSGKTTTLACIMNLINESRQGNIITIEDPIEYVHANKKCVMSQREIGAHAPSFGSALRNVMRQDPDVVMVGEMRDLETISTTITLAETGHLVFATMHSNDATQAIDRMIDVFPADQQQQIRVQLSSVLRGVVAQYLMPRYNARGLVAIREIMIVNQAVSSLIRAGRTHEIYSSMEMGARHGMITFSRSIADLVSKGLIDPATVDL